MKKVVLTVLATVLLSIVGSMAMASDIPCAPESSQLEFYTCHMWYKPYKDGIKTEHAEFCEDAKKIIPTDGCVIKGLVAKDPPSDGGNNDESKPMDRGEIIYIVGPTSINTAAYDFQSEIRDGIMSSGTNPLDSLKGFTPVDMPGKSSNDRAQAAEDFFKAKGKKMVDSIHFSASRSYAYPEKKPMVAIRYKDGKKLYEIQAVVEGYRPTYGSIHGGNSDKPGASGPGGALGQGLKGLFKKK